MRRGDLAGGIEELMKDWRSDVVRQIAVDAAALRWAIADVAANIGFARFVHPAGEVELKDVARDDFHVRPFAHGAFAQSWYEEVIAFDGNQAASVRGEESRHFAVTGANFDPGFLVRAGECVINAALPGVIPEEVLAHSLSRHDGQSVAGC